MHHKSDSDVTSLATSSPTRSPKLPTYYVQSPSLNSHDDDKLSSTHATPAFISPAESPSRPPFGIHHSRNSSSTRFSGVFRKGPHKRLNECHVILEEGNYDDVDEGPSCRCRIFLALLGFVVIFAAFCVIIWGASRPYKPEVIVESMSMHNFYVGEGTDNTGVPTKLVTANCSLKISVRNTARIFGIHVSSSAISLMYSEITVARGQLQKYYQPRKSKRTTSLLLQGERIPLYGAGAGLPVITAGSKVPLNLDLQLLSQGNVVGKLVTVRHHKHVMCPIVIVSGDTKAVKISQSKCRWYK